MKRFAALDGLRAWLVCAVVVDHLAYWSGLRGPVGNFLRDLGTPAVTVFMILSGFCIANLLIERPEPYRYYLTRRFMRLFPIFAVICFFGYFTYSLPLQVPGFDAEFGAEISKIVTDTDQHLWAHILAHATMLHGILNSETLPSGGVSLCMLAWTITVEWQFYILAPLLVKHPALIALPLVVAFFVARHLLVNGWFGSYGQPTLLPAMSGYIALGIASRLLYPRLAGKLDLPIALACLIILYMIVHQRELLVWALVYIGLLNGSSNPALDNRLMRYLGTRSYAAFLSHFLTLNVSVWLWGWWFGSAPSVIPLAMLTVPSTLALSELLHRYVEQPGIRLGSSWCRPQAAIQTVVPFKRRAF